MIDYKYSQQRGSVQESAQAPESRVNLDAIPPAIIESVPASVAQTHLVIPLSISHELATLAAGTPADIVVLDDGLEIERVLVRGADAL